MTPVRIRPLGGGIGCLMMIAISIVLSVVLTVLVNLIGRGAWCGHQAPRSSQRCWSASPTCSPSW